MPNVTVDIEPNVLKKVSKVALDRNTTVSAMVLSYLEQLAAREDIFMEDRIEKLRAAFDADGAEVGPVTWTREDLHAR
jgi:hypothetical protein